LNAEGNGGTLHTCNNASYVGRSNFKIVENVEDEKYGNGENRTSSFREEWEEFLADGKEHF
jgi:hypothetical protein